MFFLQPPEVAPFEAWSAMPDAFRRLQRSDWADANRAGAPVDSFLEGPVFDRHGNLY
ncbi:SMP-30/gluconolactonase/LRE family protein, partial [Paraburkholderia sp. SIMBA_009]